jgi:serine/threonine-protein kinase
VGLGRAGLVIAVAVVLVVGLNLFGESGQLAAGTIRLAERSGVEMVYVPAGDFAMGSSEGSPEARGDESPQHQVQLEAFWIGRTEVTNAQYKQCVAAGGCTPPAQDGSCTRERYYSDAAYADYPVVNVTWYQARDYAAWAGGRLPTEAEWEYAARGPAGSIYPWGDDPPSGAVLNVDGSDTLAVGSYPQGASWCGGLDMGGNVWEWVSSLYWPYPYDAADGREDAAADATRLVRGGSTAEGAADTRSALRHEYGPDESYCSKGFRLVLSTVAP